MLPEILTNSDKLRTGQIGALLALKAHFLGVHRKDVAQVHLPMGYGKTLVMLLAQGIFSDADGTTLVVCGKEVIRAQLLLNFRTFYDEPHEILPPAGALLARQVAGTAAPKRQAAPSVVHKKGLGKPNAVSEAARVVVALPNSLSDYDPRQPGSDGKPGLSEVRLILVDEGHHVPAKTWDAILTRSPDAKVITFTATPFRQDREPLPGRMVFSYSLADAIQEKAVSNTQIHCFAPSAATPNTPTAASQNDHTVATETLSQLDKLRSAHPQTAALVKCNSTERAETLAAIYRERLKAREDEVLLLHSKLGANQRKHAMTRLAARDYSVLVSVDMLAEGFDQENIAVLAVHDRIPDLGHFLQVAGRVTRSAAGSSHLIAVQGYLPIELDSHGPTTSLSALSDELRAAVDRQELRSTLLQAIEDGKVPSTLFRDAVDELLLPKHTLACRLLGKKDLWLPQANDSMRSCDVIGVHSENLASGKLWLAVVRTKSRSRWLGELDVPSDDAGLLLVYEPTVGLDVKSRVVFFSASHDHRGCVVDLISELGKDGALRPMPLKALKGVYSSPDRVSYFNVGLRSRLPSPLVERYRTITGAEVEMVLDGETARGFVQGHVVGKGFTKTQQKKEVGTVIGISGSGAIWSAGSASPRSLCTEWLYPIAAQITSGASAKPTALERMPASDALDIATLKSGPGLLGVWGQRTIVDQCELIGAGNAPWRMTLADAAITGISVDRRNERITFDFAGMAQPEDARAQQVAVAGTITQTGASAMFEEPLGLLVDVDGVVTTLSQHLKSDPPLIFIGDGTTVQGAQIAPPPHGMDFEFLDGTLFIANWTDCQVSHEKPPGFELDKTKKAVGAPIQKKVKNYKPQDDPTKSIFWLVATELNKLVGNRDLDFAVCDDDSYEMADFVAGKRLSASSSLIQFYLCKRTTKPAGLRTLDVQELWQQALRTAQILTPESLLERFETRDLDRMVMKPGVARSKILAQQLLGPGMNVSFEVILVQPGINVSLLRDTKPGKPGKQSTLNHAFASLTALFQRRGVRLFVVGSDGPDPRKIGSGRFTDVFKRQLK